MRRWHKYFIFEKDQQSISLSVDRAFEEHVHSMGGYLPEGYGSREEFFNIYFDKRHHRLYDLFVRQHLTKEEAVLSLASGRCANELLLLSQGYNIVCSDLAPINLKETQSLFPEFRFQTLDILKTYSDRSFDAVLALGLIYLFDDKELGIFFENVGKSLKSGGHLILDSAGSPDNFASFLVHDVVLKYETVLLFNLRRMKRWLEGRGKLTLVKKHHGFRRTDEEIVKKAADAGMILLDKCHYDHLTELRRSFFFSRFIKDTVFEKLFIVLGRRMPYVRMFYFQKAS
jgi:hypothetical protein